MNKEANEKIIAELDAARDNMIQLKVTVQEMKCEYDLMRSDLHDCVNELCYQCGQYREAHNGACDGCRWLKVKEGFR